MFKKKKKNKDKTILRTFNVIFNLFISTEIQAEIFQGEK